MIGGKNASQEQFPYHVSLLYKDVPYCGGSILTKKWVLTAASCIVQERKELFQVLVAANTIDECRYDVDFAAIHDDFRVNTKIQTSTSDIAVARTRAAMEFTKLVHPISIRSSFVGDGEDGFVSGRGYTSVKKPQYSKFLQFRESRTITNHQCEILMPEKYKSSIDNTTLCLHTYPGFGNCNGDFGGGLKIKGELVGVATWVTECPRGHPDVFTRISEFTLWIDEAMQMNYKLPKPMPKLIKLIVHNNHHKIYYYGTTIF